MKIKLILVSIVWYSQNMMAQNFKYALDLNNIQNDKVAVSLTGIDIANATNNIIFYFPKMVPGTYAVQDYGKYIEDVMAYDLNGKEIAVQKLTHNEYQIATNNGLSKITYLVNDAMDMKVKKNRIFEPASTNIEANKNVIMNNGGFFGCIKDFENIPITMEVTKPIQFFGATSLPSLNTRPDIQIFSAKNYYQLIDCPILFCEPDTAQFMVNNTKVTIACYDKTGAKRAQYFYQQLKRDMDGVAKFFEKLPVDNYTFIVYIDDFVEYGPILDGEKRPSLTQIFKIVKKFRKLGVGALEHGNSSLYYLANFGENRTTKELQLENQFTNAATHEFMHIVTPLSLHSQYIGNFDFTNPVMSKHLWLYEGCTEYFTQLVKLQAGIYSTEAFLNEMGKKIIDAKSFPIAKMSMTQMSEHVLEDTYHKQYTQVYDRGAVLAWLLDIKIITLSNGTQTLKSVLFDLVKEYGANKSFDEATIISKIVNKVDPKLQTFFDNYISGNIEIDLKNDLNEIGVLYADTLTINAPRNPFSTKINDVHYKKFSTKLKIKSVGQAEWAGLQAGDIIEAGAFKKYFQTNGKYVAEGEDVTFEIKRNGMPTKLKTKATYQMQLFTNYINYNNNLNATQLKYWQIFSKQYL
jgi:predicted metalloprotease with PDZ domain